MPRLDGPVAIRGAVNADQEFRKPRPRRGAYRLDTHLEQIDRVRSILWAIKSLLANNSVARPSRTAQFEIDGLAATGLQLIDRLIDEMRMGGGVIGSVRN